MKKPLFYKKYKKSNEIYYYYLGILLAVLFILALYLIVSNQS